MTDDQDTPTAYGKRERVPNQEKLWRDPVHASRAWTQTGLLGRKFRYSFAYHFGKLGAALS
jgi:hypothetical protein